MGVHYRETDYGFEYGAIRIERITSQDGRVFIGIGPRDAKACVYFIDIYASPTGKSIRVLNSRDRREWMPIPKAERCGCGAYTHDVAMCDECDKPPDECFCDAPGGMS